MMVTVYTKIAYSTITNVLRTLTIEQPDRDRFIHNQHIALQGVILVELVARRGLVLQKPVNGLCFHTAGF